MDSKWVCVYKVVSLARPDRMEVTSLIYPRGSPEGATKLALRKTFQDFRQLHQEASELFSSRVHSTKIGFPQLQESPESCERLLDFCSRFPQVRIYAVYLIPSTWFQGLVLTIFFGIFGLVLDSRISRTVGVVPVHFLTFQTIVAVFFLLKKNLVHMKMVIFKSIHLNKFWA